jgi:hypothetical protein
MAQLGTNFDATHVQPQEPFSVIPGGKYKLQIVASEIRATNNGAGQYLWFEIEILDGEYQGRKLWDRLNLWNDNAQAVEIAQRTLSAMCHATGQLHVEDSEALHFKPMIGTVRVRPAGPGKDGKQYDASNEIRGYEAVNGAAPAQAAPAAAVQQAAAPAPAPSAAAMPWKRK